MPSRPYFSNQPGEKKERSVASQAVVHLPAASGLVSAPLPRPAGARANNLQYTVRIAHLLLVQALARERISLLKA